MDTHRNASPDEFDEPHLGWQAPPAAPADLGGRWPTDGASAVMAMPVGPRPEQPVSPVPTTSGPVHPAPTSGLPFVNAAGHSAAGHIPAGQSPLAGGVRPVSADARPVSGGSGWYGGDPAEETQVVRHSTEAIDRAALRRPAGGGPGQLGDGVYRSRRPGAAVAIVVVTVLFELMALRLLASAFLTSKVQVGGSIASAFLVLSLPMFGFGLYGLLRGAAAEPNAGVRAWLRPPLVYLPVALTLFVVAGLAAS